MKRRFFLALAALFIACAATGGAFAAGGFPSDPVAINRKAESVLMLEVYDSDGECIATASGFVAFDDGILITNYHVIEDSAYLLAFDDAGASYRLEAVWCADEHADIAILAFTKPTGLTPLALDSDEDLLRAEAIVAIGSPMGITNTVSMGNVSAIFSEDGVDYIQFTAPISSGSSGGALFNDSGLVVGITSATYAEESDEDAVQNLNYAVDIDMAIDLYGAEAAGPVAIARFLGGGAVPDRGGEPPRGDGPSVDSSGYKTVQRGSKGESVAAIQRRLIELGYLDGAADGIYGSQTASAVAAFMERNAEGYGRATGKAFSTPDRLTAGEQAFLFSEWALASGAAASSDGVGLIIGEDAWAEWYELREDDLLQFRFEVTNASDSRVVTAFEAYLYAEDARGRSVYPEDEAYMPVTERSVRPGKTVYSDYVYMDCLSQIDAVYCGVHRVWYADGTVEGIEDIEYASWSVTD